MNTDTYEQTDAVTPEMVEAGANVLRRLVGPHLLEQGAYEDGLVVSAILEAALSASNKHIQTPSCRPKCTAPVDA